LRCWNFLVRSPGFDGAVDRSRAILSIEGILGIRRGWEAPGSILYLRAVTKRTNGRTGAGTMLDSTKAFAKHVTYDVFLIRHDFFDEEHHFQSHFDQ